MTHRGPDDGGVFITPDKMFGLGNRRLSIIDLSPQGHMPMSNENSTIWLTYNGEIYNFPELRSELEGFGHEFRSHTDSEVLIHGYEQWGIELLKRLNGMFAFGVLDLRTRPARLVLARDRFGVKPLYYWRVGNRLAFASEIKSILAIPEVSREVDVASLHRYLSFLWTPGPETLFKGIHKLPPGHYMEWFDGHLSIQRYWNLSYEISAIKGERELAAELQDVLNRSITRQLISDVPLGVFLSGGLDSSTIAAIAAQAGSKPLNTYTIAYRPEDSKLEQSGEDAEVAREVACRLGARHHEMVVSPHVAELLPKVVWHLDEPVADAAAISTYLICAAARPEVKVLLSGQGGDEVFAGYRAYTMASLAKSLNVLPAWLWKRPANALLGLLPALKNRMPGITPGLMLAAHRFAGKLVKSAGYKPEESFIFSRAYYTKFEQMQLYSSELRHQVEDINPWDRSLQYFEEIGGAGFLNRMLYVDSKTFLPELNLTYSDKLSSAASVEVRVPFLDNEIVDFMSRVPLQMKLRRFDTKHLMRRAVKDMLPARVLNRRKAGFGAPIRSWLRRDLREMVDDLLSDAALRKRGYFDCSTIRKLVADDRGARADNSYRIWALLTLEVWHQAFLDSRATQYFCNPSQASVMATASIPSPAVR